MKLLMYAISVAVLAALCRHSFGLGFWETMGAVYLWAYLDFVIDGARGEG